MKKNDLLDLLNARLIDTNNQEDLELLLSLNQDEINLLKNNKHIFKKIFDFIKKYRKLDEDKYKFIIEKLSEAGDNINFYINIINECYRKFDQELIEILTRVFKITNTNILMTFLEVYLKNEELLKSAYKYRILDIIIENNDDNLAHALSSYNGPILNQENSDKFEYSLEMIIKNKNSKALIYIVTYIITNKNLLSSSYYCQMIEKTFTFNDIDYIREFSLIIKNELLLNPKNKDKFNLILNTYDEIYSNKQMSDGALINFINIVTNKVLLNANIEKLKIVLNFASSINYPKAMYFLVKLIDNETIINFPNSKLKYILTIFKNNAEKEVYGTAVYTNESLMKSSLYTFALESLGKFNQQEGGIASFKSILCNKKLLQNEELYKFTIDMILKEPMFNKELGKIENFINNPKIIESCAYKTIIECLFTNIISTDLVVFYIDFINEHIDFLETDDRYEEIIKSASKIKSYEIYPFLNQFINKIKLNNIDANGNEIINREKSLFIIDAITRCPNKEEASEINTIIYDSYNHPHFEKIINSIIKYNAYWYAYLFQNYLYYDYKYQNLDDEIVEMLLNYENSKVLYCFYKIFDLININKKYLTNYEINSIIKSEFKIIKNEKQELHTNLAEHLHESVDKLIKTKMEPEKVDINKLMDEYTEYIINNSCLVPYILSHNDNQIRAMLSSSFSEEDELTKDTIIPIKK